MRKINRLLKNEDFKSCIDKHNKIYNKSFSLYYCFNNLDKVRVGISVSKKNGIAVVRNKIKRQIRMIVSDIVPAELKMDLVVICNNDYIHHSYQENKQAFLELFKKVLAKEKITNEK